MADAIPLDTGTRPLFARIMGPRFDLLPPMVQRIHSGEGLNVATGQAIVVRGRNPLTSIVAAVFGFPPAGLHRVCVTFAASPAGERWTRDFGGHCFSSRLTEAGDRMIERFGPYRFTFDLVSEDGAYPCA